MVAAGYDPELVKRVITMVDRNEYKRRQSPPGIKITPKAFGKDRRMPITNGYWLNMH
jgi:NAD+ synthase (glutamine-hydrolysing)